MKYWIAFVVALWVGVTVVEHVFEAPQPRTIHDICEHRGC